MSKDDRQKSSKKKPSDSPADADDSRIQSSQTASAALDVGGATSGIPVIALGGSAGALDTFKQFFDAMPTDSGAAFVVIQHLAPAHTSLLSELLTQHTTMKVVEACADAPVEPNCVYVIPPSKYLGIRDGVLYLVEQVKEGGIRMAVDFFLRSLSEDRQERAICVLVSGAGSDGTLGVRAIRGAGGLTIVQDPQTAQYGDMPRSAIATKMVDHILPVEQMPQAIMDYLRQPYIRGGESAAVLAAAAKPDGFNDILSTVLAQTGCDFRYYKKSTILRRIERRMGLHRISDVAQYSDLLHRDANEVNQLLKDLLINVTAFFRDADAFEALRREAITLLVAAKQVDEPLRVWVAGCSSGEEAYSIAMLLREEIGEAHKNFPIQVFATDIDEDALAFARLGLYPESIATDVSPERLERFFVRKEQGYQVGETLRNAVVFATQNLITDPPFSKMDLISCRNLLIYLDADTQAKLIPLFNFGLNPGGYLFLGKSEGLSGQNDLFAPVSKAAKLFRRCTPTRPVVLDTPILPGQKRALPTVTQPAARPPATAYADVIRQALLNHFAASVVLVEPRGRILQLHGPAGKYVDFPQGEPNLNLLDTAKEGLALRLRSALHTAIDESRTVVLDNVPVARDPEPLFTRVTVTPLARRGETAPLVAVIFEDVNRPQTVAAEPEPCVGSETEVRQLEDELRATQQDLQSSVGELQSANEELRVSNEEVVSTNEELQSTNEELETSKEELQSVNEELTTVNSQLQEKVSQLDAAASDVANLLNSAPTATLFLDDQLRIKFFTPATTRVLKLISSDMGRPISDLSMSFVDYDLAADARTVAQDGSLVERDVRHTDGSYYLVRIMPYRTSHGQVDGVVATFADVTRLRLAEQQARRLATVVIDSNDAVIVFDPNGSIQTWNRGAQRMYGWSEEEALRMNIRDLAPAVDAEANVELFRRLLAGEAVASFETKRRAKDDRVLDVWLTVTAVPDEAKRIVAVATTERDITERKLFEDTLRKAKDQAEAVSVELARSNKDLEAFAYLASHDLQEPLRGVIGFTKLLQERYQGQLDAKADEYIGFATEGARRMNALIVDLLAYSKVGAKGQALVPTDLEAPLFRALGNLKTSIEESGAEVMRDELPTVAADPGQITQLFQNLIGNALKFRSDRRPEIHVGAKHEDGQWIISVRDNGIGLDMKHQERIFQIFQRLHDRSKYSGTGIGLAICKKIIERHGGRIWVESKAGEGSTFFFTLPAVSKT